MRCSALSSLGHRSIHRLTQYRHRVVVGSWHCDLRPDHQTAGSLQGVAGSLGSCCLHYSASQHVTARHFNQSTVFFTMPLPMKQQPFCLCCPEYQCIVFHCGGAVHCMQIKLLVYVCVCVYTHACTISFAHDLTKQGNASGTVCVRTHFIT